VRIENRNGHVANAGAKKAIGTAEREAAVEMLVEMPANKRTNVGADKAYDTKGFVRHARGLEATTRVAWNAKRRWSPVDERTRPHLRSPISQRKRKRVKEIFGWMKTVGMLRKRQRCGTDGVGWMFTFGLAVYKLLWMRNPMEVPG